MLDLDLSCESERLAVRYTKEGRTHVGVAAVRRNERGQPVGLGEPLALDVAAGWGLTWQDPVALVALEEGTDGVSMVRRTLVGGTSSITAGVAGAGRVVADRVGGDILLSDGAGQVWQRAGATWRSLGADVSDLAYSLF